MREGRGLKPSMMSLSNIKVITKLFVKCVNFSHKIKNVLSVFLLILPLHFVFWGWGYKLLTFPNYKKNVATHQSRSVCVLLQFPYVFILFTDVMVMMHSI